MKRIATVLLIALMMPFLTACGCKHEWQDADCVHPMTCSLCGDTKGKTTPHTWVDATCAAPKTCSVCGETEGEALPHTLSDANYQDAPTCTVCGAKVGEPLTPRFEEKGIETIFLPLTAPGEWSHTGEIHLFCNNADLPLTGEIQAAAYPVETLAFGQPGQSAEDVFCEAFGIEPIEGYAVYCVEAVITVNDSTAYRYGIFTRKAWEDYYTIELHDNTNEYLDNITLRGTECLPSRNTISSHGVEMPNYMLHTWNWSKWIGTTKTNTTHTYFYQPADYDGNVCGFFHTETKDEPWEDGMYIYDLADEYSVLFRFSPGGGAAQPAKKGRSL